MGYNISTIRGAIEQGGGLARPCRYLVMIGDRSGTGATRNFSALIQAAEFPGKHLQTVKRQTYGPSRKMPYLTSYDDFTMSILCTANMAERAYFDAWQNKIINVNSGYVSYYDDYFATITIIQLNEKNVATFSIQLEEAYPTTVTPQQLSYTTENTTMSLSVSFAYHKWRNIYQAFDDTGSGVGSNIIDQTVDGPRLEEISGAEDNPYSRNYITPLDEMPGKLVDSIDKIGEGLQSTFPVPSNQSETEKLVVSPSTK